MELNKEFISKWFQELQANISNIDFNREIELRY